MALDSSTPGAGPARETVVHRHSLVVRVTHWINAVTLIVLLMSGLNIFNAHPALYWGEQSRFDRPALRMYAVRTPTGLAGVTEIGGARMETTGLFGASVFQGRMEARGFPAWLTLPAHRDLGVARHWHFFFAWLLVLNGVVYASHGFASRHVQRDLWAPLAELKTIPGTAWSHLRLKFHHGDGAAYNVLQKLSYLAVVFVLGPLIVLTGLAMSPGMNAATLGFLPEVFGGRQSARTIHFICAALFALFIVVHLTMVVLSGALNNVRSMITGRYALPAAQPTEVSQ